MRLFIFILIFSWLFSGFPRIWQNPPVPPEIQEVYAAVAHNAASESHTGTTGSASQASFSWSHAGAASNVKGVVVFVTTISITKTVTSVTYGGVTMTDLGSSAAAVASVSGGEPGRIDTFFLGASVPQGTQTVVVNRTNNTTIMYAAAATITGTYNTETTGYVLLQGSALAVFSEQSVNDGSPGSNSTRYAAGYTGAANPASAGTNSTLLNSIDFSAYGSSFVRETTAGQGARLVGMTSGSDDRAGVHLAIREIIPPTTTLSTGTNPGNSTIAPGGSITSVNGFTLTTNVGTDAITAVTINLSTNSGVGTLTITDGADSVLGSIGAGTGAGIVTGSNSISITSTNVTTGGTAFKVKVTPLSHANMPAPDGGEYAITGVVTDWTGSNTKAGQATDTSDTVTIDNNSPTGTTGASATPGDTTVDVSWTPPGDSDFQQVYIYCKTSSMVSGEAPTEGTDPTVDGTACDGTARLKYKGAASPQTISSLTNDTLYYFRIYARDNNGNFTAYASTQEVSATPVSAGALTVDIVDAGGTSVPSPSMAMGAVTFSFSYQTANGTFGVSTQKIRVNNTTAAPQWTLTIAASGGPTILWSAGTPKYDFNDPTANAGDGGDADVYGGQMTINASGGTLGGTCSATGITKGSGSFSEVAPIVSDITLLTADASANTGCYWDLTGVSVSQTIPASQSINTYTLNLTLTVI